MIAPALLASFGWLFLTTKLYNPQYDLWVMVLIACAAVPPECLLPVLLDIATTNDVLHADPLYLGLRDKPPSEEELDELTEELRLTPVQRDSVRAIVQRWGIEFPAIPELDIEGVDVSADINPEDIIPVF